MPGKNIMAGFVCGRLAIAGLAAAVTLLVPVGPARAQGDDLEIGGPAFSGATGRVGVNASAGDFNQQANVAVIANGGTAIGIAVVTQHNTATATQPADRPQTANITGDAFAGATGAIAVNGTAGSANQQANLLAITIGIEGRALALEALAQSSASTEPPGSPETNTDVKSADIGAQPFTDASGLVQVNLSAGERNSSANVFALTLPGGAD